jgi:hypothetical protein
MSQPHRGCRGIASADRATAAAGDPRARGRTASGDAVLLLGTGQPELGAALHRAPQRRARLRSLLSQRVSASCTSPQNTVKSTLPLQLGVATRADVACAGVMAA